MPPETPRDQPTNVATQEAVRPPDNSVVTSDVPAPADTPPEQAGANSPPAADPDGKKPAEDPNNPNSAAGNDNEETPPRKGSNASRRIKKLTGKLSKTVSTNKAQAARIAELEQQNAQLVAAVPAPVEPKLEDFKTPQEYAKAFSKYESDVAAAKRPPAPATPPAPADPPQLDPAVTAFHEAGREMLGEEFAEALEEENTAVSQVMAEYLFESDVGPAIYVHLANNQDDARKIYDSTAPKAISALKALEDKAAKGELDIEGTLQIAPAPTPDPPDGGQVDGDPPPPSKNPGGTKAPTPPSSTREPGDAPLTPDPNNEGMEEYAERRRKEIARAAGHPV